MSSPDTQILSRLYVGPPKARRRTPLERLPFTLQQHYATVAAASHGTHMLVDELGLMMVPCELVIPLCPPDIQPAEGMPWDQPARFPTWIFWRDGRSRCILTPEELAQQPPGYVCYPRVPFPALPPGSPLAGMGETWYGPFAPHRCGYPDLDSFGPAVLVWATDSLTYGEQWGAWRRSAGELFVLEDLSIDSTLLETKVVERVKLGGQRLPHSETERVFRDKGKMEAYILAYETGYVLEWVEQDTHNPSESIPIAPVPTSHGRPLRYKSAQDLYDALVAIGETLPAGSRHSQEVYAEEMGMSLSTLLSHLKRWRKQDPTQLLVWERIITDAKAQRMS